MKANIRNTVLVAGVLFIQCVAIGWLIWRYENVVRHGTEVRFRCTAYDPYDPLRGRYLRTTVREDSTNCVDFASPEENFWEFQNRLFARLEPSSNGLWRVAAVAGTPPADGGLWVRPKSTGVDYLLDWTARGKDESWGEFHKRREASPVVVRASFPDQLFLNERLAPAAEKVLREATSDKGKGAVAVYRAKGGEIVLTDIEIDGKSVVALAREAGGRGEAD